MNVYDYAHSLAKAIKASPEYIGFKKCQDKLEEDQSAKEMLTDFRKSQLELQKQKMSGLEVAPEQEQNLAQRWEIINMNLLIKEYLEAEYRFSVMLTDVQKIIGEALADILSLQVPDPFSEQEENRDEEQP
ncbi:MAG: YlbF family regulator [Firmicutes bacterium]|nr:YlbF family regulator [Bacillota bacterium]